MAKEKFDIIQSTCIPIEIDNNNTDNIIPARYLAFTTRDPKFYGDAFMHDLRYDANNEPIADFVMNKPEFSEAPSKGIHEIIVGGQNWGSGSSREHAACSRLEPDPQFWPPITISRLPRDGTSLNGAWFMMKSGTGLPSAS